MPMALCAMLSFMYAMFCAARDAKHGASVRKMMMPRAARRYAKEDYGGECQRCARYDAMMRDMRDGARYDMAL